MENFTLIALVEHLRGAMADMVIRRIVQHQPNGFILHTRSNRFPALKLVLDAAHPAMYPSESKPPVEFSASDFLMVLRKHLTSAELIEIEKPLDERIVQLKFRTTVPTRELEVMTMVVELLPNAPNLILLDTERRPVASFLPITPQHQMEEFDEYRYPKPASSKLSLSEILDGADLSDVTAGNAQDQLVSRVSGIGPIFAAEIAFRAKRRGRSPAEEICDILLRLRQPGTPGWLYTDIPLGAILEQNDFKRLSKAVVSPIELESLARSHSSKEMPNLVECARYYFDELESRQLLGQAKLPLLRELREANRKLADREKRLAQRKEDFANPETWRRTAQLLQSSGIAMDQRQAAATVTDYFEEKPSEVLVSLDPALTVRENIDRLFRKYQKATRGTTMVERHLAEVRHRISGIDERIRRLEAIKDWATWLAVSERIAKQRSDARAQLQAEPRESSEAPKRRFRSILVDGFEVLVGRNSRENDELTFDYASPEDFWFHAADYSGSHVVVRNPQRSRELPPDVLVKAAQLAAFFSQARNSPRVEVHYTRKKHVSKPKRSKAGLARLVDFKSIRVEPRNWLEA